ncbi:glycosyltransferase family 4 protein [Laribacter hongkongensis]|uniref:glycosyltransferase family 4 protein n=1 Tax=Laribacter hongkongensis TaxID=168471 RepID=UPI001EFE2222|nr:glycosyltransferase family 4 protein [Laribacter hongkongensis]MCG8992302.1 glycosyltransferase family 4 protein [Laribacter hongkongensis]MCG8999061.1 glycosyltransferase family 4 protein [Laribacter hongkongensis]MCG9001724.1 glycosyltransferase family 4 protein [Laribacter hongkongensis]MCG9004998.1 glycosyltransferase family 4 protein [Laribacter hongkongensis]MCG9007218.1 glycosyltransferase family 4 protein [Laribacter hongkongensis]
MRILLLSFYFEPDLSAGSFRMAGLVEALQRQIGPEVRLDVMTTQPNRYASYSQAALPEEVRGGVTVKRFALPAHRSGFLDQSRAFAAYAYQVIKATRGSQYDLVFASSSRLFTATLGAFVASRVRAPLYLDIRDIFVDTLQDVLSPLASRLLLPVFRLLEKLTVRRASHVNLVSAGFLEYFRDRYPDGCFSVIPNGIDDVFMGVDYAKETTGSKTIVLYAGNIGEGQGLARIIPGLAKAFCDSHEFWMVGDGGQRSQLESAVNDLNNVKIMSPVSRKELLALYRGSDVLFLHLNDYPAFRKVLPSKLFEYAVTGKPIVAGVAGYAAIFLQQVPGVVIFQPCQVAGGVAAIRNVKLGPVSRQPFVERYRRAQLMQELAGSLLAVAKSGASQG